MVSTTVLFITKVCFEIAAERLIFPFFNRNLLLCAILADRQSEMRRRGIERYVKAVLAVPSRQTYLFCIFPRNDYDDYSTSVNKFICMLNQKIHRKLEGTDIIYLDVFDRLLQDGRLNPELTIDDLHLNGKGYSILSEALRRTLEQPLKQAPDL